MAKKNEILLSIALEGDQDVKSKLQAVGDASKKSIGGIEKSLGGAKSGFGGLGESAGKLSEALAPLTEASGLAGLAGLSGIGGLFGRITSGLLSPAGLVAGITGVLLGMAKIGEESDKAKLKLKALGASGDTFEKLNKTAKDLGVSTESLQPSFEKFQASKNKINADQSSGVIRRRPDGATAADEAAAGVRIIGGGKETGAPVPDDIFLGALKTLVEGAQSEKIPGEQAGKIADAFSSKVQTDRKLTPDAVDTLNPGSQNILAKSLSTFFGRDLLNGAELKEQLGRPGQRAPSDNEVFRSLNAAEPDARKQAESASGLTAAFDALLGATKHLADAFSGDVGIADAMNKLGKVINDTADNADKIIHPRDFEPGGPKFIGPVSPGESAEYKNPDVLDLGKALATGKSDPRFDDSAAMKAAKFLRDGPSFLQRTPEDFLDRNLLGKVGSASRPEINPLTRENLGQTGIPVPFRPDHTLDGLQIAPERPALPPAPQQSGDNGTAIGDALRSLVQGITEKAGSLNPADTRVQGPVDTLGIRGSLEDSSKDVASSLRNAGAQLAAAIADVAASVKTGDAGAPVKVQAAAGGGLIRRLDGGGGVNGPGTTTSDSIPAMLSDGEYVIKASSARKLGRGMLDHINAGGYADGGAVSRKLRAVRRFAAGGDASDDNGVSRTIASQTSLGPGDHEITFDPASGGAYVDGILHLPGDPLLDDPSVRQGMAQSRAGMKQAPSKSKHHSDFTGRFGHDDSSGAIDTYVATGGLITPHGVLRGNAAHFAKGGAVGSLPRLSIGGGLDLSSLAHLAGGGPAPTLDSSIDAGAGGSAGHLSVDLRTNHGDFKMMAPDDVARQMSRAAVASSSVQTSPRPSWYGGG